jgi:integrase
MSELRQRDSIPHRALEFAILTAARTGEVIGARWSEIDLAAKTWTIPGERMKTGQEHTIPLSDRAIEIIQALPRCGEFVFAGRDGALGKHSLLEALKPMNGHGLTVHGFRSTFRDWAGDHTNYDHDTIENALAHKVANKVEAAYRRGSALQKRVKLMQSWADYCGGLHVGKVVSIKASA